MYNVCSQHSSCYTMIQYYTYKIKHIFDKMRLYKITIIYTKQACLQFLQNNSMLITSKGLPI